MAEIGYFVQWISNKPSLCRFYVAQTGTTTTLPIYSNRNSAPTWVSSALTIAPATAAGSYKGWLADNVIAFFVRCVNESGAPITKKADGSTQTNNGYSFDSLQGYTDPSSSIALPAPALPAAVEITLVVVDDKTAQRIDATNKAYIQSLLATFTNPANLNKDKTTSGSIAYFMDRLPPYSGYTAKIKPGAEAFSTTVFLPRPAK